MGKTGRCVDFSTRRSKARAKDFDTLIRGDAKRFRFLAKPGAQIAEYIPKQFQTAKKCRPCFSRLNPFIPP